MPTIPTDVLQILSRMSPAGNLVPRFGETVDRKLYAKLSDVLESLGGKWNRKANGHVFPTDTCAAELLEYAILTGEYARKKDSLKEFNFFRSPPGVVAQILDRLDIQPGHIALEPSAGDGAIAGAMRDAGAVVRCCELQPDLRLKLVASRHVIIADDFLSLPASREYDRIGMNPPFSGQRDIEHVAHALDFLRPGGRLVAVMSASVLFRTNKRAEEFRALLAERGAETEQLPDGAFKESGTAVKTILVTVVG